MPIEIIVPRLGWSMEEGAFVAWLKKDGEFVHAGEPLFSIEGDKAVQEIESIDSGILQIAPDCPKPGAPVRVGDLLGHLLEKTESAPLRSPPLNVTAPEQTTKVPLAPPIGTQKYEPQTAQVPTISPRAHRVATELGVDWRQVTGSGRTGRIREKDIRAAAAQRNPFPSSISVGSSPVVLVTGGCGFIGTW